MFAGYVSLIDNWLQKLLAAVESSDEQILLVVSANQGHSFGEVTDLVLSATGLSSSTENAADRFEFQPAGSLNDATVRTPLLIAEFSGKTAEPTFGSRHSGLVQPADLAATLLEWFSGEPAGPVTKEPADGSRSLLAALADRSPGGHEFTFHLSSSGQMSVRNRNWALVTHNDDISENAEVSLFVKPDDQWDVNDVAAQYPDVVEHLLTVLRNRLASRQ